MSTASNHDAAIADGLISIGLVVLTVAIWMTVKTVELLIRQLGSQPRHMPVWAMFGGCAALWGALAFGQVAPTLAIGVSVVALLALISVAKTDELYQDSRLQRPWNRAALVQQVLHESWWTA